MENLSDAKLKELLKGLGGRTAGKQRRSTMIKRIEDLQAAASRPAPNAVESVLGITPAPVVTATKASVSQQQVLDAVKHAIAKGMKVEFSDNSWTFSIKGRMDSGTMSQPLSNIVKCADLVTREARQASIDGDKPVYA